MSATTIKAGDKVTCGKRLWRVIRIVSVFGIPSADLHPVRQDGTDGVSRRRFGTPNKNLPLGCLTLACQEGVSQ